MCKIIPVQNLESESHPAIYTQDEKERVQNLILLAKSDKTRKLYKMQLKRFAIFCANRKVPLKAVPAEPATVALYIDELTKDDEHHVSASYLSQAMAAIKFAHDYKRIPSPTADPIVKQAIAGARRKIGTAVRKKAALSPSILKSMISTLNLKTVRGLRDRAILLMGFAGAFRRSELIALNVDDLERVIDKTGKREYIVNVRKSKTDQEGMGMQKALFTAKDRSLCPVRALDEYLAASGIQSGAIFRSCAKGNKITAERLSGYSVALIVQNAARKANVDLDVAAHSLRAGFVTSAMIAGASERSIMNQTGHRSVTVMRGYQRRVDVRQDNAASMIL